MLFSYISDEQIAIMNNLSTLIFVKSGSHNEWFYFSLNEVNDLMNCFFILSTL